MCGEGPAKNKGPPAFLTPSEKAQHNLGHFEVLDMYKN